MGTQRSVDAPTGNLIDGGWVDGPQPFDVVDKYTGQRIATVGGADSPAVTRSIDAAAEAAAQPLPPADRARVLHQMADEVEAASTKLTDVIVAEAGFPLADAAGEVARAIDTLRICATEASNLDGTTVPFSGSPRGVGRTGFTERRPVGIVAAITPFNSPLNTVCHKVGPAIAAGNAVVLKPSERTPLTANVLGHITTATDAPPGLVSVVHGGASTAQALLDDTRVDFYAFTGSTAVGEQIHRAAGLRRTQLELGSIAATVVLDDADIDRALPRCVRASFRKAGQVCTSIQLLLVQRPVYDSFRSDFLRVTEALTTGNPHDPATDVGPLISEAAAIRVEQMLAGHTVTTGGSREGSVVQPAVAEDIDPASHFFRDEIFGPATCLIPIDGIDEAIELINSTPYGLATGVFTNSIDAAYTAADRLRVGAVHVNETSSSRVDLMPYGGVKASGHGLEGPRYSMREMSEQRLVTFSSAS